MTAPLDGELAPMEVAARADRLRAAMDVAEVPANGEAKVNALITPNAKAIAGDYVVSLRASGEGVSESATYRVTVTTSTLWGVTGVGVVAVALLVLFGAVGRFGRR